MRPRRRLRPGSVDPDMNVTPLVDVVLVLLIIFMVVAPHMEQDIPVELPGIFNPDPDAKGIMDPLRVTIATPGEYYIGDTPYDLDGTVEQLGQERALDPHRRLVVRADARLKYGDVRPLLEKSREIGFPGTSFLVGERHRPAEHSARHQRSADEGEG